MMDDQMATCMKADMKRINLEKEVQRLNERLAFFEEKEAQQAL